MANTSIRVDTVGLGINWALGETYRVAMDEGFIRQSDGLNLPIAGNLSIMSFSTPATPPQIANTIPTHTSTAPINIQDISFTIDRSVGNLTVLGGNVYLNRQGSPNVVVKTYVVSNTNTTGNTVSFTVIGNLEASQTYFITSNANIFLDRDGFKNNAISNSSSFRFVSPSAPTVTAFTPGNATVASRNFTNVTVTFDRTIYSNTGNFFLHNANTSAVIRTYPISSALIGNNKVSLDVVGNITANGYYYITSNANVIMDITQIKYPGITSASTFTFKAPVSPYLESTVPTNTTTTASRSLTTASLTLDRTVTALTGNVYLYKQASPNVLLKTWSIGSNVTFDSDRTFSVTVPQGMLAPTQAYYVTTDANIAKDLTYINFPGISTTGNTFTFTTDVAPLVSTFSPTYMEAIDETNNTISFTMDRTVNKNVGNLYLYKNDIVNGNALVYTYNINSNTTLTTNTTISANVAGKLLIMEKYFVTTDPDILSDYTTGEKFQGILDANTFVFTTAVDREYYANEFDLLFPTNVPQITDANSSSTYSITITLADAVGHIQQLSEDFLTPAGWDQGTKTYSITGTKNTCNAILANLYYFPNKTVTSNTTLTYSQSKDSVLQKTLSFILFGRASVVDFLTGDNNTYAVVEDSKFNFMPFYIYPQWDANIAVLLKSVDSVSGNVITSAGTFNANTATGWTTPYDGVIYKTFNRPANISVYNSQIAEIRDIYYWLASDYTSNIKIDALLGIESTVSGNTLSGGTVYNGFNNYTITPSGEYNLLTSGTITEDGSKAITLTIEDADVHPSVTYNVLMQQISPDPGLVTGSFTSPGYASRQWGSINDTQAKSAWNAVTYYTPADYTGNILIGATITKIQSGQANIVLANNVAINLTNSSSHNEYSFNIPGLVGEYSEDTKVIFDYDITDQDSSNPTYYITFNQISPDPATNPMDFIRDETVPYNDTYTSYGNTLSISGSKSYIVNAAKGFYPPPDYSGNIVFGFTQIKSSYNGNITHASNLAITYTNVAGENEYNLTTAGSYAEDNNIVITANITDSDTRFSSYYLTFDQISPDPVSHPANVYIGNTNIGTNGTIYNTRTYLNSQSKQIIPPADWTGDIVFGYTQKKATTYAYGNVIQASNIGMVFNNSVTHSEYSLTTPIILESEIETYFGNIVQITDQANNKQYSVTFTANSFPGNLYINNVVQSKHLTFTGTKSQVNANIANLAVMADFTLANASSSIYYTQSQTTDGISQVVATPINANIIPSTYYTLSSNIALKESFQFGYEDVDKPFNGYTNSLGNVIQISNIAGNVSVTISQTSNIGYFLTGKDIYGNLTYSPHSPGYGNTIVSYGNTLTISGNAATVSANLGTIRFDTFTGSNANIQSTTLNLVVTSEARGSNHPTGNVILNTSRSTTIQCNYEIGDYVPSMGGYFFGYYRDPIFDGYGNATNWGPISHYLILSDVSAEFEANLYTSANTLANVSYDSTIYNYGVNDYRSIYWQDGKRMTDWWYTNFGNLSPAADTIKSTTISGFNDWYLPSARELLLMFSLFKPYNVIWGDWPNGFLNGGFGTYSPNTWETKYRLLPDDGAFKQNRGGGVDWPWWVHYSTDYNNHWGYIPQTPYAEFQFGNSQAFSSNISVVYASSTYVHGSMYMPYILASSASGNGFKVDGSLRQNSPSYKLKWRPIRRHPI